MRNSCISFQSSMVGILVTISNCRVGAWKKKWTRSYIKSNVTNKIFKGLDSKYREVHEIVWQVMVDLIWRELCVVKWNWWCNDMFNMHMWVGLKFTTLKLVCNLWAKGKQAFIMKAIHIGCHLHLLMLSYEFDNYLWMWGAKVYHMMDIDAKLECHNVEKAKSWKI